jgi:outer membrane receptor for ferrienterochelin and colicins
MYTIMGGYQYLDANDVQVLEAIANGQAGTIAGPLRREDYHGLWGRSRHSGTVRLQYDAPERLWSANIRAQFVGRYGDESLDKNGPVITDPPRKVLDREDEFVAGYVVLNMGGTYTLSIAERRVVIGAGINNLLDRFHPTLIPSLVGRQFYLQLTVPL